MSARLVWGAAACAALLLAPFGAAAQDLERIATQISSLEDQAAQLQRSQSDDEVESPRRVEERLTDAELLFNMQDYTRASILYLDVVENHTNHPGYPEALFRLAESLFQSQNFYGARSRYREVLDHATQPGFRGYAQDALGRLIEIAIHLDEFEGVESYFSRLSQLPPSEVTSATHYARGRFLYHQEDYPGATQALGRVSQDADEYLRAQYHLGVIEVSQQRFPQAIEIFLRIGQAEPTTAEDRQVVDLAQVAIGALRLELDQPEEAIRAYQNVSRNSRVFDQALFQAAAAYSRMGDSTRAERALEVLTVATPDSAYLPRAKILRGNLLLDTGRYAESREVFYDVRQQYEPVREQLEQALETERDPATYFQELVRANLEVFDISSFLPPLAIRWVQEEEGFRRSMETLERTASSRREVHDTERLLIRLEAAVAGPSAVNIFPGMRQAATQAVQIENELAQIRGRLVAAETQAAGGGGIADVREERRRLEADLRQLPTSTEGYEAQEERARRGYRQLGGELSRINGRIDRLQAMIVAIELYLRDTTAAEARPAAEAQPAAEGETEAEAEAAPPISSDRAGLEAFESEIENHRQALATYRAELTELQTLVDTGQIQVGIGDDRSVQSERLRERYNELVAREREALSRSGGSAALQRAESLFQRVEAVQRVIDQVDQRIVGRAQAQSQEVQDVLDEERTNLERYLVELAGLETEAEDVIGHAAYENFQVVRDRFYELVRQADVGIVDVAWAEREEHRHRIDRLSQESRRQLQLLDDEFSEVMDEVNAQEGGGAASDGSVNVTDQLQE
jgi:tetratricopeptide (TPR) repeat protein